MHNRIQDADSTLPIYTWIRYMDVIRGLREHVYLTAVTIIALIPLSSRVPARRAHAYVYPIYFSSFFIPRFNNPRQVYTPPRASRR